MGSCSSSASTQTDELRRRVAEKNDKGQKQSSSETPQSTVDLQKDGSRNREASNASGSVKVITNPTLGNGSPGKQASKAVVPPLSKQLEQVRQELSENNDGSVMYTGKKEKDRANNKKYKFREVGAQDDLIFENISKVVAAGEENMSPDVLSFLVKALKAHSFFSTLVTEDL